MPDIVSGNAVIGQSGGPTAVINQSLAGVIEGLQAGLAASGKVERILGMRHGVRGLVKEGEDGLVDLAAIDKAKLEAIARTPSAALGSTRDKPDEAYCEQHSRRLPPQRHPLFLLYRRQRFGRHLPHREREGGSRAATSSAASTCRRRSTTISSRTTTRRASRPPRAMSRSRRWATRSTMRASAASRSMSSWGGTRASSPPPRRSRAAQRDGWRATQDRPAPHLIYLPEVPFSTDAFLADVEAVYAKLGRCQIAVSEGIRDADGRGDRAQADALAGRSRRARQCAALGLRRARRRTCRPRQEGADAEGGKAPRVRADTFGYMQRCWPDPSPVDAEEARAVGRYAAELAARGRCIGLGDHRPHRRTRLTPIAAIAPAPTLSAVARRTRHVPAEFISGSNDVSAAFHAYCRPLVGDLPKLARL